MLINDRVTHTFPIFGKILNLDDNQTFDFGGGIQVPVSNLIPLLMVEFARLCKQYPERAEGILDWMFDAILYMKGDLDQLPKMDLGFNLSLSDGKQY